MISLFKLSKNLLFSTVIISSIILLFIIFLSYKMNDKFIVIFNMWFDSLEALFVYFIAPIMCITIATFTKGRKKN